jgi:hypothetical protein
MRALSKLFLLLLLLSPLLLAAGVWLALSGQPLVTEQASLSHQDIARAKEILKSHDPRYLRAGARPTIEIGEQDLNLAANYLLQKLANGSTRVSLAVDRLQVEATLLIPRLPLRNHLNITATVEAQRGVPQITHLRIGDLPVPGALAGLAARQLLGEIYGRPQLQSASELIEDLRLSPDRLRLTYRWSPALLDQARDTLLSSAEREALRYYHGLLTQLQDRGVGRSGPLVSLLEPLFAAAAERSLQRDPVAENTALLTLLGTWASRHDVARLVPDAPRRPAGFRLKIDGRLDFAQHFLASAALAARGDTALSDAVGLFKEIADTDRGSGFSFTDIAADRAGTRFGELATRSAESARTVQQRLARGITDSDIMPPARDLPEHMNAQVFEERFGQVGSPAYRRMMDEIERRIDAVSLYRL